MSKSVSAINKKYGEGTIQSGAEFKEVPPKLLDSGVLSLNLAIGTNGFLGGRIGMVWGQKSSGKTLLASCFASRLQKQGLSVAFLDVEGTYDLNFAQKIGVDPQKLFLVSSKQKRIGKKGEVLPPLCGEEWVDILIELVKSEEYALIILDSVPAMVPKSKMEAECVDQGKLKAASAQLMAEMLPKINSYISLSPNCFVFLITQERSNPMVTYGSNRKAAGGDAAGFFITYEMYAKKLESIKQRVQITTNKFIEEEVAIKVKYTIAKNKVARIGEPAEFIVNLQSGVDIVDDTFSVAKTFGVIELRGSTFSYKDEKAQGQEKFKEIMYNNDIILEEIRDECMRKLVNRDETGFIEVGSNSEDDG